MSRVPVSEVDAIMRLGVIGSGETAVRVLTAVGGLNHADADPSISTVLFHLDRDPQPWYSREADEVRQLIADGDEPLVADVLALLQKAQIDTLWLGHWSPTSRADLIAACESCGIAVIGPDAATVRVLADPNWITKVAPQNGRLREGAPTRRVEVEVLADDHGNIWTIGGRDVSVRRGNQTLIAEAPCSALDPELAQRIRSAATELAQSIRYRGAGVITFVHDGANFDIVSFDPVAAPEHATTEERTGASIIDWRVRVQRGEALTAGEPEGEGIAIEARLVAEDPEADFAVASGRISLLSFPVGTGVRIDSNRRVGDTVDAADPLIAVVTAWGPDRASALGRLRLALERTSVVIDGGATNRTMLLGVIGHEEFVHGRVDDRWLDRVLGDRRRPLPQPVVLLAAAVEAYEADRVLAQDAFYASAGRGRPQQPADVGSRIELRYSGVSYQLAVDCVGSRNYTVRRGADVADVTVDVLDEFERRISCGGRRHRLVVAPDHDGFRVELNETTHLVEREDGVVLRADWPALVVAALVEPGDVVEAGDPIAVLESMKMETTVNAPFAGEVVAVSVTPNSQVDRGAPLVRVRARRSGGAHRNTGDADQLDLSGLEQPIDFTRKPCDRVYGPLGDYLLGYDLSPVALRKLLTQQRRMAEIAEPDDPALLACEDGLLDIYADLGALYRPQTEAAPDELTRGEENTQEYLVSFLQWLDADRAGLPDRYRVRLQQALDRFGVHGLERTPALETAMMWLFRSFGRLGELSPVVTAILQGRLVHRDALATRVGAEDRARLDRLATIAHGRQQAIADLARDVRFHYFDEPTMESAAAELYTEMAGHLTHLAAEPSSPDRAERVERLVWCPQPMRSLLLQAWGVDTDPTRPAIRELVLEVYIRRFYRIRELGQVAFGESDGYQFTYTEYRIGERHVHVVLGYLPLEELPAWSAALASHLDGVGADRAVVVEVVAWRSGERPDVADLAAEVSELATMCGFGTRLHRLDVTVTSSAGPPEEHLRTQNVTLRERDDGSLVEDVLYRNLHPMLAKRLEIWRLSNFELERRPSSEDVYLFLGAARTNPKDQRLFALAEIRDLVSARDEASGEVSYPRLERTGLLALAAMRTELARYPVRERPSANRLVLDIRAPWDVPPSDMDAVARRFAPFAARVGLEKVVLKVRIPDAGEPGGLRDAVLHIEDVGHRILVREDRAGDEPVRPLSPYQQKILTAARFGSPYPYEIVRLLTQHGVGPHVPAGSFQELDLDADDQLVPVDRDPGNNSAHIVVGLLTNHTHVVPEGITRVTLLSDPTQGLGNLAEPECRRINAALAYALEHRLPVEWFAVSSGALISMDSGTENMDWIALTLRRLIEFTQAGGEVNIVVTGINVGGQPYWNAEATMLNHTKGILVMSPASTMVLTGKQALDFSGAVSAEDNFGIGGYDRVMGPNGQGQYCAPSFPDACSLLMRHYDMTYVVPGERFPRRRPTADPTDRDVRTSPHATLPACPFRTVGDVFSSELNPERKQPFDMRSVMRAVADADSEPLERWKDLRDGDTAIVWDTTIGGIPVCVLGTESHTVGRKGFVPADGPPGWTSGTLFPHSSRKLARAINAVSGNRPLVVLANLSGFDGSPESMRSRQLEFGAEIGRAITNFDGPIVFVVVSRYHGGAFVVFSKALNASMEIAAVEGSFASVIGGAPAAATVFVRDVKRRTENDPRVREASEALAGSGGVDAAPLRAALAEITEHVRLEKLGEVADEFDAIHTIDRALRVGSVDRIIAADDLRPYVIDALERGMARHV